jgi:hypothetical protein
VIRHKVRCLRLAIAFVVGLASVFAFAGSAFAAAMPQWQIQIYGQPTNFDPASSEDTYVVLATNVGEAPTKASVPAIITATLPAGVRATSAEIHNPVVLAAGEGAGEGIGVSCPITPAIRCEFPSSSAIQETPPQLLPGQMVQVVVRVEAEAGAEGPLVATASVSGGGASGAATAASPPNNVGSAMPPFGFEGFSIAAHNRDGTPYTEAAGHPYSLTVSGYFNTALVGLHEREDPGQPLAFPIEEPKVIATVLPPGLIGNPQAVPPCSLADFWVAHCPAESQLGTITVIINPQAESESSYFSDRTSLYNLSPEAGHAATLGFNAIVGNPFVLNSGVETGGGYGVLTTTESGSVLLTGFSLELWGVPADPQHNVLRGYECTNFDNCTHRTPDTTTAPERPFLRLPTACPATPLTASASADSWETPGVFASTTASLSAPNGCNAVPFAPSIEARPTTNLPDAPTGLDVDLHVPQNEAPKGRAAADLKDVMMSLPQGLRLNPSSANGLGACTEAQIELHGPSAPTCPDASKLGTVEVDTPLLDHPLPGSVYLGQPHENPFGSLLALYAVVNDPVSGVIVKLPGKVEADPATGQLTTRFEENPQLPFEDFHLHLFAGAQGSLRTPSVCGTYKSTASLTPWSAPESGPPAEKSDEFAIAGSCAENEGSEPNSPSFDAGTESPQAGKFSPFSFKLHREDGSQEFRSIETTLPPGLTGKLAGIAYCPEGAIAQAKSREHDGGGAEEIASPSCPASSEVGTVEVAAGAGPDPYHTTGHAYLAGPYNGAPLSLAIVTPAVAGPFDLGDVLVRTALQVNPETAQITAKSDEIPHILQGIPLDVRSVVLKMSRPNFTLNPTDCDELAFSGSALSVLGNAAPLAQRFQVGGCSALPFKPKLALSLKGKTTRAGHPALKAVLTMKPGEANVASAQVTLPRSEFLDNAHIKTVCTRVQFGEGTTPGERCPAGSVYGHARAITPLLEKPLEGPVYLRSSSHTLPDLVAALNGQIQVVLDGRVDSIHGGIRNTFEVVPDAPVSKFTLEMQGAKKGLLENSENLCSAKAKTHATVAFTAQNGKSSDTTPALANGCKGKGGKGKKGHKGHR